jgi:hypothetical protein
MIDIDENQESSTSIIEQNSAEGSAENTWIQAAVPTGNIIPGEHGTGNFLAVRRTKQLWHGAGPGTLEEFQYRVTEDRSVKYRFPVPLSPSGFSTSMVLGANEFGFTTRGNTMIAFNTESGQEIWRWTSKNSNVLACAALVRNKVLVHDDGGYTILKDGIPESYPDEYYMLFVFKYRPDWANF